jgi:hypothetical protein
MTGWSHFVHKFKNSSVFLPISYNERVKDVLPEKGGIVLVHCVTTTDEPYMFTICVEYKFSPFDLSVFLRSLGKLRLRSPYEGDRDPGRQQRVAE